ncbi:hypothetical protein [Paracoccus versutus]|uniref:hypothetical protein n=1 Tax=Paracoccus versutus TaxID=34007 RepID=UPI000DF84404|nr:hypothetical protein [Paracoccus versutus]RDD70877.1 hypothetical protein DVR11_13785 [Paracoccus versutus]
MEKVMRDEFCRFDSDHAGGFPMGTVILAVLTALAAGGLAWWMGWGLVWIIVTYCLTGSATLVALAWHNANHVPGDHAGCCGRLCAGEAEEPARPVVAGSRLR